MSDGGEHKHIHESSKGHVWYVNGIRAELIFLVGVAIISWV
jgi:hypothetical protein